METPLPHKLLVILIAVLWFPSALALDDLIINGLIEFETCDEFVVPVLIHTMPGGDDLEAFARLIERDQRIWLTKSHYLMFQPEPIGIFVDLLQGYRGGFITLQIFDSDGILTWESIEAVNPLQYRHDIMRRVVPVPIVTSEIQTAFPRSDVYRISAEAFPRHEGGGLCGGEASTSIIVNLAYE